MLSVVPHIQIPETELHFSYARSSGPGGQNVNKVSSKAVLRWDFEGSPSLDPDVKARFRERFPNRLTKEGFVVLMSDLTRDRLKNQEDCLEKLRALLRAVAYAPKPRKKTKPSRSVKARRRESKKRHSELKKTRSWRA